MRLGRVSLGGKGQRHTDSFSDAYCLSIIRSTVDTLGLNVFDAFFQEGESFGGKVL